MSEQAAGTELQEKYQRLLDLEPLVAALAGLPVSEGRLLVEEQIEGRATTMKYAYRLGLAMVQEVCEGDPQKYRQFRDLLPMTLSLAGLPPSSGRLYGEDQVDARSITVKAAYRVARGLARECLGGS